MRIISGKYKGKIIRAPKKIPARPTTDFAKEGLFNILRNQFDFSQTHLLDLFAGTGNMTYEFISRGVTTVVCVDSNYNSIKFISSTIDLLDNSVQKTCIKNDAFKFLAKCYKKFDIIFADPPYDMDEFEKIPELVFASDLLNEDGWLIVEHSKHTILNEQPNFVETRKYGNVNFSIFSI